jgi:hypothetical protein
MGKRRDEPDEPTLELPSFFRRRKRRAADEATVAADPDATTTETAAQEIPGSEPSPPEGSAPEPAVEPATTPAPVSQPEPTPVPAASAPTRDTSAEDTSVLEPEPAAVPDPDPEPAAPPAPGGRRAARAARRPRTRPVLSAGAASLLVGAVVGAVGTGLTWAALQGCEALRGTDSCGGPGLLVLVAILALMVIAGALLLKALRVTEPNATSFLGVGLMTVIVLVTLMESLFSAWMFLAVPVLTALSYLAAQWVSTRFVDTEKASPGVDVR